MAIPEIGEKIAESINSFFTDSANRQRIEKLKRVGLNFKGESSENQGILKGKTFVITGTLENISRDQAKELIEKGRGKGFFKCKQKHRLPLDGRKPRQ